MKDVGPEGSDCTPKSEQGSAAGRRATPERGPMGCWKRQRQTTNHQAVHHLDRLSRSVVTMPGPDLDPIPGFDQGQRQMAGQFLDTTEGRWIRAGEEGD